MPAAEEDEEVIAVSPTVAAAAGARRAPPYSRLYVIEILDWISINTSADPLLLMCTCHVASAVSFMISCHYYSHAAEHTPQLLTPSLDDFL